VTLGKSGLWMNNSLPGTGVYKRTKLPGGSGRSHAVSNVTKRDVHVYGVDNSTIEKQEYIKFTHDEKVNYLRMANKTRYPWFSGAMIDWGALKKMRVMYHAGDGNFVVRVAQVSKVSKDGAKVTLLCRKPFEVMTFDVDNIEILYDEE